MRRCSEGGSAHHANADESPLTLGMTIQRANWTLSVRQGTGPGE
jgi:hypothetical protein